MRYILPYKEKRKLHGRAYRAQQRNHDEVCGLLVTGSDKIIELVFLKNISNDAYNFKINRSEIIGVLKGIKSRNKHILGSFHSHPVGEAIPSKGDLENGFYKGFEMIYDVCAREVKLWRLNKKTGKLNERLLIIKS